MGFFGEFFWWVFLVGFFVSFFGWVGFLSEIFYCECFFG